MGSKNDRARVDRALSSVSVPPRPHTGWLRAVRTALGMSTRELAELMGVSRARISQIEAGEVDGRVQLDTLQRAAAAMGCKVSYVIEPIDGSLEDLTHRRAVMIAGQEFAATDTTMALENQSVDRERIAQLVERRAAELMDRRGLWSSRR